MVLPTSPQGERMQSEISIALLEACIYLLNHKRLLRVLGIARATCCVSRYQDNIWITLHRPLILGWVPSGFNYKLYKTALYNLYITYIG